MTERLKLRDFVFPGGLEDLTEILQEVQTTEAGPVITWAANQVARWDTMLAIDSNLAHTGLMARYLEEEGWTYDLYVPLPPSIDPRPKPPIGNLAHFIWQKQP